MGFFRTKNAERYGQLDPQSSGVHDRVCSSKVVRQLAGRLPWTAASRSHAMKKMPIRRTSVSALTDNELIIFDIAAIDGGRRRLYRHSVFSDQWNYPSHGFDDESLIRTLHRFEANGLIKSEACFDHQGRPDRTVRLTQAGGALWESERLPDWTRFLTDQYSRNRISIFGYSAVACADFFEVACDSQFVAYKGARIITAIAQRQLIYWRPACPVHLLCARVAEPIPGTRTNWSYFESRRSWWRFPNEIGTFWLTEGIT